MTTTKSVKTIIEEIKLLKSDSRYKQPPALVEINAPLALIQVGIEAKITALRWVLSNKKRI